ncbi:MAG: FixG Ig-like domain-containing protein [Bacteroidales bacterium]
MVGTLFALRTDFETTILRQRGTLFQKYGEDSYSNIYQVEIVNKTRLEHKVEVKLLKPAGQIVMMGDDLVVEKGEAKSGTFLAILNKETLKSSNTLLTFGVFTNGKLIEEYDVTFVGPNSLDK